MTRCALLDTDELVNLIRFKYLFNDHVHQLWSMILKLTESEFGRSSSFVYISFFLKGTRTLLYAYYSIVDL